MKNSHTSSRQSAKSKDRDRNKDSYITTRASTKHKDKDKDKDKHKDKERDKNKMHLRSRADPEEKDEKTGLKIVFRLSKDQAPDSKNQYSLVSQTKKKRSETSSPDENDLEDMEAEDLEDEEQEDDEYIDQQEGDEHEQAENEEEIIPEDSERFLEEMAQEIQGNYIEDGDEDEGIEAVDNEIQEQEEVEGEEEGEIEDQEEVHEEQDVQEDQVEEQEVQEEQDVQDQEDQEQEDQEEGEVEMSEDQEEQEDQDTLSPEPSLSPPLVKPVSKIPTRHQAKLQSEKVKEIEKEKAKEREKREKERQQEKEREMARREKELAEKEKERVKKEKERVERERQKEKELAEKAKREKEEKERREKEREKERERQKEKELEMKKREKERKEKEIEKQIQRERDDKEREKERQKKRDHERETERHKEKEHHSATPRSSQKPKDTDKSRHKGDPIEILVIPDEPHQKESTPQQKKELSSTPKLSAKSSSTLTPTKTPAAGQPPSSRSSNGITSIKPSTNTETSSSQNTPKKSDQDERPASIPFMLSIIDQLIKSDRNAIFLERVDEKEVPDYYKVIKTPMDFTTIKNRIRSHKYSSFKLFENDVNLVFSNATIYNSKDTIYYREARRLQALFGEAINSTPLKVDTQKPPQKPKSTPPPPTKPHEPPSHTSTPPSSSSSAPTSASASPIPSTRSQTPSLKLKLSAPVDKVTPTKTPSPAPTQSAPVSTSAPPIKDDTVIIIDNQDKPLPPQDDKKRKLVQVLINESVIPSVKLSINLKQLKTLKLDEPHQPPSKRQKTGESRHEKSSKHRRKDTPTSPSSGPEKNRSLSPLRHDETTSRPKRAAAIASMIKTASSSTSTRSTTPSSSPKKKKTVAQDSRSDMTHSPSPLPLSSPSLASDPKLAVTETEKEKADMTDVVPPALPSTEAPSLNKTEQDPLFTEMLTEPSDVFVNANQQPLPSLELFPNKADSLHLQPSPNHIIPENLFLPLELNIPSVLPLPSALPNNFNAHPPVSAPSHTLNSIPQPGMPGQIPASLGTPIIPAVPTLTHKSTSLSAPKVGNRTNITTPRTSSTPKSTAKTTINKSSNAARRPTVFSPSPKPQQPNAPPRPEMPSLINPAHELSSTLHKLLLSDTTPHQIISLLKAYRGPLHSSPLASHFSLLLNTETDLRPYPPLSLEELNELDSLHELGIDLRHVTSALRNSQQFDPLEKALQIVLDYNYQIMASLQLSQYLRPLGQPTEAEKHLSLELAENLKILLSHVPPNNVVIKDSLNNLKQQLQHWSLPQPPPPPTMLPQYSSSGLLPVGPPFHQNGPNLIQIPNQPTQNLPFSNLGPPVGMGTPYPRNLITPL